MNRPTPRANVNLMPATVKTVLDVLLFALFFDHERVGQQQTVFIQFVWLALPKDVAFMSLTTRDLTSFHHQIINKSFHDVLSA